MNEKGRTADERFLIKLFEIAKGDPAKTVEIKKVAAAASQKEMLANNIVKHLAQANFVKKVGDTAIRLTQLGCDFVIQELE